jgi:hypothetical protein
MATDTKRNSRDFFIFRNFQGKNMYEHQYKAGFRCSGYDYRLLPRDSEFGSL